MLVVSAEDAGRLYKDFYSFLSSCGIDAVKTDAQVAHLRYLSDGVDTQQFMLDELASAPDRSALLPAYLEAWSVNHLRHFSARAISCMSQVPAIMFGAQLVADAPPTAMRNSDDFFPHQPDAHPWHVFCNAHNARLTRLLNVAPDWDMFQTAHPWAGFHSAARCVSGGPVAITDVPGRHDVGLLRQMTAVTPRGNTVVLVPDTAGRSTAVYTAYHEPVLLKVATYHGMAGTGTSILGVFNCTPRRAAEMVCLADFPGADDRPDVAYLIRSHRTGQVAAPAAALDCVSAAPPLVHVDLDVAGWDVLSAVPVSSFTLPEQHGAGPATVRVANLGLVGKMTGSAAVESSAALVDGTGRVRVEVALRALGMLGVYISDLALRDLDADLFAVVDGRPVPRYCVAASAACPDVLEIDVARAWRESAQPGWDNGLVVDVVIR